MGPSSSEWKKSRVGWKAPGKWEDVSVTGLGDCQNLTFCFRCTTCNNAINPCRELWRVSAWEKRPAVPPAFTSDAEELTLRSHHLDSDKHSSSLNNLAFLFLSKYAQPHWTTVLVSQYHRINQYATMILTGMVCKRATKELLRMRTVPPGVI